MLQTLWYAASLIPEISDDIDSVDAAMRMGYNWKYGPFQLIDRIGVDAFAASLQQFKLPVPKIIAAALGKKLYDKQDGKRTEFMIGGKYAPLNIPSGSLMLDDIKLTQKPIAKNVSAQLWDIGDGILCIEFLSKQNTFDPENLKFIAEAIPKVQQGARGLVFATDGDNFSFGANIGYFLLACNTASWWAISDMIKQGQDTFMALKYAPFPSVTALAGMALGGGCELNLHVSAVQAHIESYIGLVEAGIGVVPGWGGCTELLLRHIEAGEATQRAVLSGKKPEHMIGGGPMPPIAKVFEYISTAKVAASAYEAQDMLILNSKSRVTMNRRRVLADAKELCLSLAKDYKAPQKRTMRLPGISGKLALMMAVENFRNAGKASQHDEVVAGGLATVLTGGDTDMMREVTEQDILDLEHEVFMELCKTERTRERIAHTLATGKPLRN
ncbi:MAG: enoyl-CoA hydratase-related protein [Alphaproteobacteria bacterium]